MSERGARTAPPPPPAAEASTPHGVGASLRTSALFFLLFAVLVPASAAVELFPDWDLDPTSAWLPSTGLRPAGTTALVILGILACALALFADVLDRRPLLSAQAALAAIGAGAILVHGHAGAPGMEHTIRAAPWLAFAAAWIAAAHIARDPRLRAITLAVLAAFALPLLAKGLHQILIEHPATVAGFQRNKAQILSSNGWAPDSASALAYERRLLQAEASAWFGLTNVAATFAAAITAGLAAMLAVHRSTNRTPRASRGGAPTSTPARQRLLTLLPLALTLLASFGFLILTKSKGGVGAAAIAITATAALALALRWRPRLAARLAPAVGPAVILAVLAGVGLRGLLGEDLAERSLLFRSQYITGALRIWADNPLLGVGPDGFQDAYAAAKPALSPETVQSPHSVLFDWTATLGLPGLAWAAWLVWQSTHLGRAPCPTDTDADRSTPADRDTVRFTALTIAVISLVSIFIARALATPEFVVMRLAGLAAWLAAGLGLLPLFLNARLATAFCLAAGLALLAHTQIEVTPVWVNAAPLLGVFLGTTLARPLASGSLGRAPGASHGPPPSLLTPRLFIPIASVLLAAVITLVPLRTARRWQTHLAAAAETVRPAAEFRTDFKLADTEPEPAARRTAMERLAGRVSAAVGGGVPPRPDALDAAIHAVRLSFLEPAAEGLAPAVEARPAHTKTITARGKLLIELAHRHPSDKRAVGFAAAALDESDAHLAVFGAGPGSPPVSAFDWQAVTRERTAEILTARGRPEQGDQLRREALESWRALLDRTPHAVRPAVRAMDLADRLDRPDEARAYAAEALRRDGNTRLDPLAGLSDAERTRAERLAGPNRP